GTVRLAVRTVSSRDELDQAARGFPAESYPLLLQKRIVGPGLGVFLLWWDGATVAVFAHRRLREKPPTGGVSTYRESVPVRDDLLEYSERLLDHFRWRGAAMVEFKEDSATGTPYLMEVNGRFWGSLQLGIDADVDFPEILVRLACGEAVEPPASYRPGIRSRWLWGELDHLLWILRAPRGYRSGNSDLPSRLGALARFLVPWRPGDRLEVLRFSDPKPFLRESAAWFRALGDGA
ncbi:MAG: ATP-grasp domain-containing protein, partial [Gemmatimonadetes bacterium]|nr:ATP-grasp domain-containing protein [Gemmatimonadota bacterium]